ncbi:MAG TPA: GntR family transcriptional regulator [Tepidisphaeraceae bacterium]|jgi:DNA-binding LacI/PurR family transcriptional regulator|nr:GntR family transcriptional regulator [Tepidisphaeraceae bacterium]
MVTEASDNISLALLPPRTKVARLLRSWITEGRFGPGELLPSERVLARELGVARETVRAVVDQLTTEGMVGPAREKARRVVRGPAPVASDGALLAHTVAIVTDTYMDDEHPWWRSSGYDTFIDTEAAALIGRAGLNALTVHPDRLRAGGPQYIAQHRPFGVLLTYNVADTVPGRQILVSCRQHGIPVVAYGDAPALDEFDRVTSDHADGAAQLADWLIARGHRRIARFMSDIDETAAPQTWVRRRREGYERAMAAAGLEALPGIRTMPFPLEIEESVDHDPAAYAHLTRAYAGYLLEHLNAPEPVTAFLAINDRVAYRLNGALRLLGKTPGRDVMVVGYDGSWRDNSERQWEPVPPAATVDKQNREIARELVQLLLDRSAGKAPSAPQQRTCPPKLVEIDAAGA